MQPEISITTVLAVVVAAIATYTDIKTTKIFNVVTFPAMLIGLIASAVEAAMRASDTPIPAAFAGLITGVLGWLVGLLSLGVFKFTIMKKFGGGDVKLMAALGSFIGPAAVFGTFLYYCAIYSAYTCTIMAFAFPWQGAITALATKTPVMTMANMEKFNAVRKAPLPVAPFILAGLLVTVAFYHQTLWFFGAVK